MTATSGEFKLDKYNSYKVWREYKSAINPSYKTNMDKMLN